MSDNPQGTTDSAPESCVELPVEVAEETVALYTLEALPVEEACVFAAHIERGCSFCAAQVKVHLELLAAVGQSTCPPAAPPARLRSELLARIEKNSDPHASSLP